MIRATTKANVDKMVKAVKAKSTMRNYDPNKDGSVVYFGFYLKKDAAMLIWDNPHLQFVVVGDKYYVLKSEQSKIDFLLYLEVEKELISKTSANYLRQWFGKVEKQEYLALKQA